MKTFVYTALIATVASDEEVLQCVNPSGDAAWTETELSDATSTATVCKAACVEAIDGDTDNDYCCGHRHIVPGGAFDDLLDCVLYTNTAADGDLRSTENVRSDTTYQYPPLSG